MNSRAFEAVTRRAADVVSRRSSLLALSGAALATVAGSGVSEAKKKSGNKCKKKEKNRCSNDAADCKTTILSQTLCDGSDPAGCLEAQACCEECSANGFLVCLLLAQQP